MTPYPDCEFPQNTVAVSLNLAEIQGLAAGGAYAGTFTLSGESAALVLSWLALLFHRNWVGAGYELTPAEIDIIDDMIAQCLTELMDPVEADGMRVGTCVASAEGSLPPLYLKCDGQLYDRVDYPLLYAALHSSFIENDDEFRTPDLRGRVPIGEGTGWSLTPRDMGDNAGEEEHTLSEAELARHDHTYSILQPNLAGTIVTGSGYTLMEHQNAPTSSEGSGYAHENMPPFFVIRWIIYAGE